MRNNIVHPDNCGCRTCKRHKKEDKKDEKRFNRILNGFYVCVIVLCCLI